MQQSPIDILHTVPTHTHIGHTVFAEELVPRLAAPLTLTDGTTTPEMRNRVAYH